MFQKIKKQNVEIYELNFKNIVIKFDFDFSFYLINFYKLTIRNVYHHNIVIDNLDFSRLYKKRKNRVIVFEKNFQRLKKCNNFLNLQYFEFTTKIIKYIMHFVMYQFRLNIKIFVIENDFKKKNYDD